MSDRYHRLTCRIAAALACLLVATLAHSASAQGITAPSKEITLYPGLHARNARALRDLRAEDLVLHDGAAAIDTHEVHLTTFAPHAPLTLVFDRLDAADRRRSASLALKLLKPLDLTANPTSLWFTDTDLHLLAPALLDRAVFTQTLKAAGSASDAALLTSATEAIATSQAHHGASSLAAPSDAPADVLRRAHELITEQHIPAGIATLFALAESQREIPGRKSVLFFTESLPTGPGAASALHSLFEQLTAGSISLYLIDLRAVDRNAGQTMAAAIAMGTQTATTRNDVISAVLANPRDSRSYTLSLAPADFRHMTDSIATMELGGLNLENSNPLATLASASGGTAADIDVDTAKLSRALADDLHSDLQLTFPVGTNARDGKFHLLTAAANTGGIALTAPLGYFAESTLGSSPAALLARHGDTVDLQPLQAGASASDLPIKAGIHRAPPAAEELAVQVPVSDLQLRRDATTHLLTLHATLGAQLRNSAGDPVGGWTEEFHRRGATETEAEVRSSSLTLRRTLALPPGEYQLHAVVRDWISGRSGELSRTVTLLPPNANAGSPAAAAPDPVKQAAHLELLETALVNSGLTPSATTALTPAESAALLQSARTKALAYADALPNFLCLERIDRSTDPRALGLWKHRDTLVELLRYHDHREARSMLEIDGQKSTVAAEGLEGARSNGEFGGILAILFAPEADTDFTWLKTVEADGERLEVFHYHLPQAASGYFVTDDHGEKLRAGLHGQLYLDANTQAVRRVLAQTDPLPPNFGLKASWMAVEYSYLPINNHEYLLPTRGEVGLQQRKGALSLLQLRFTDYRRFGSRTTVHYNGHDLGTSPD